MRPRSPPAPAELALQLEDDADAYPEDRGELLTEAAHQWRLAGDAARSRRVLDDLIAGGGEDGAVARSSLASDLVEDGADLATYHRDLQRRLSELAERGARRIELVPGTPGGLLDFVTRHRGPRGLRHRHRDMEDLAALGWAMRWPPGRNDRCWCGSDLKDKRCCGSPAPHA